MNSSPHAQAFAYRRNPSHSVHHSTFHPQQVGHSHSHGHSFSSATSSTLQARPPRAHYTTSVVPFQPAQVQELPEEKEKSEKKAGGFNLASLTKYANIDELKGLVDRFGGLEGILSTVTTVQKVVSTVGQIAPMVKVFSGVLKNKGSSQEEAAAIPARRRVRTTRTAQRPSSRARATRSTKVSLPARQKSSSRRTSPSGPRKSTPYRPPANR